jgi:hypothetical protein
MQYAITLPADYDMRIIRRRVAERGGALDAFPGLGIKAYCVRERGEHGSPVNQYAPFYLWNDLAGMNRFLWDGGFANIVRDFGRPAVRRWSGLAFEPGPGAAGAGPARAATLRAEPLGDDGDPGDAVGRALGELEELAKEPGLRAAALAVDTHAWQLAHFALWDGPPAARVPGARYTVLRVNAPGERDLRPGRHW